MAPVRGRMRPGQVRAGGSVPLSPHPLFGHSKVTVTHRRRLSWWSPTEHRGELPSLPSRLAPRCWGWVH